MARQSAACAPRRSGLAALYLGELDDADRAFAALELGGTVSGDGAAIGRALSLRGMVAQHRGQLALGERSLS